MNPWDEYPDIQQLLADRAEHLAQLEDTTTANVGAFARPAFPKLLVRQPICGGDKECAFDDQMFKSMRGPNER